MEAEGGSLPRSAEKSLAFSRCSMYNNLRSRPAGVMELVDVVDSKSTAGDSVPVRVRPPAPARRKRHIACDELFHFIAKLIARSRRCSSSNRTCFAGFGLLFYSGRGFGIALRLVFTKEGGCCFLVRPSEGQRGRGGHTSRFLCRRGAGTGRAGPAPPAGTEGEMAGKRGGIPAFAGGLPRFGNVTEAWKNRSIFG